MIKPIIHDPMFLARKSVSATKDDLQTSQDLLDTITFHKNECVGMAANMIGVSRRIIIFDNDGVYMTMYNPEIIRASGVYEVEECCLSLAGKKTTKRYKMIKVRYQNAEFKMRDSVFTGWTAQIIQHEIDHCNGILI